MRVLAERLEGSRRLSIAFLILAAAVFFWTGCAANKATATVDPKADLDKIKKMSVVLDDPGATETRLLIERKLSSMGYQVIQEKGQEVDALVTFKDRWAWDITTYMVELTIVIREPKTEFPLATGNSLHTSLTRKSPQEMVDEVLNNIFKGGK